MTDLEADSDRACPLGERAALPGAAFGVAMACFYSSVFLIWDRLVEDVPSPVVGLGVYVVGVAVLACALSLARRADDLRPPRRHWPSLLVIGVIGFTINASILTGIALSTAAKAAILTRTDTFFAAVIGAIFIGERLRKVAVWALALMFAGAVLAMDIKLGELMPPSRADLLFVLAAFCLGLNAVIIKTRLTHLSRFTIAQFNMLVTLLLFAVLVTVGGHWGEVPRLATARVGALTLICGCLAVGSYVCYYSALRLLQSWEARSFSLLVPVIVGVGSLVFFGEALGATQIAGMVCVVAGALVVNRAWPG